MTLASDAALTMVASTSKAIKTFENLLSRSSLVLLLDWLALLFFPILIILLGTILPGLDILLEARWRDVYSDLLVFKAQVSFQWPTIPILLVNASFSMFHDKTGFKTFVVLHGKLICSLCLISSIISYNDMDLLCVCFPVTHHLLHCVCDSIYFLWTSELFKVKLKAFRTPSGSIKRVDNALSSLCKW